MPWCPKCGSEYRSGTERCSDCDEPLVPEKPPSVIELKPAERSHAEFLPGVRLASDGTRRTWRMRAFWLVLGALAVVRAVPPTFLLMRGEGAIYENEGVRWQLGAFGSLVSYEWLYPAVLGHTITEGIRRPFGSVLDLPERPLHSGLDRLIRQRDASRLHPVLQWEIVGCEVLIDALLGALLMALALQRIVAELHDKDPRALDSGGRRRRAWGRCSSSGWFWWQSWGSAQS